MFERIRKWSHRDLSLKSVVAFILFGAIVLVFVLFGFPQGDQTGTSFVAQVNNSFISEADVRGQVQRMERMYAQYGMSNIDESMRQRLRSEAVETLIDGELLAQTAVQSGVRVSNQEVIEIVTRDMKVFQEEGRFSRERYVGLLQANNLNPRDFENSIRKETGSQRFRNYLFAANKPLEKENDLLKRMKERQVKLSTLKWMENQWLNSLPPASESKVNELVKDPTKVEGLRAEYEKNKGKYTTPESVVSSHILYKVDPSDKNSIAKAMDRAQIIRAGLTPENFAETAKKESEDLGSRNRGGDLGSLGRGSMPAEFDQVVFSAPVGNIVGPITTESGIHLVWIRDRKSSQTKSFEDVQKELAQNWLRKEDLKAEQKKLEDALQRGDSSALNPLMAKLKVNWQDTGWIDYSSEPMESGLSDKVLQLGLKLNAQKPFGNQLFLENETYTVVKFKDEISYQKLQEKNEKERAEKLAQKRKDKKALLAKNKNSKAAGDPADPSSAAEDDSSLDESLGAFGGANESKVEAPQRGYDIYRNLMEEQKKSSKVVRH